MATLNSVGENFNVYIGSEAQRISTDIGNKAQRISAAARKAFQTFEEEIWKYLRETSKIFKEGMKISKEFIPEVADKIEKFIPFFGFFVLFDLMFILEHLPSDLNDAIQNFEIRNTDREGFALSSIGALASLAGATDSFSSFSDSLAELGIAPRVALFSVIGLPLAIGLLSYATVKGIYDVRQNINERDQIPENKVDVRAYLEQKLNEEQKTIRHTDKKVVKIMKKLQTDLENNDNSNVESDLAGMRTLMDRKIKVGKAATFGNAALLTSLVACSCFGLISKTAVSVVSAGRAAIMLGKHHYNLHKLTEGIDSLNPRATQDGN